jgi:hypothetical protein
MAVINQGDVEARQKTMGLMACVILYAIISAFRPPEKYKYPHKNNKLLYLHEYHVFLHTKYRCMIHPGKATLQPLIATGHAGITPRP